jgi:hypothetical protein
VTRVSTNYFGPGLESRQNRDSGHRPFSPIEHREDDAYYRLTNEAEDEQNLPEAADLQVFPAVIAEPEPAAR